MIIWLTGLSGSGKSTLSEALANRLRSIGTYPLLIDGDRLRSGLCHDLGFSKSDRAENIRRAGAIAILGSQSGITTICSLISPNKSDREKIRALANLQNIAFLEVYVSAPLDVCEARDPKGLYKSARAGLIPEFTGLDSHYDIPTNPEVEVPTHVVSIEEAVDKIYRKMKEINHQSKITYHNS